MTTHVEHGFSLFTDEEIAVGLDYAAQKDHVSLDYGRLRRIADAAGKTRINAGVPLSPKEAATRAIKAFEREFPGSRIRERLYKGYVHAIAKMMSERNPNTHAKRRKEAEVEEILAVSHNIDSTPPIDPEINRQLALGLTGAIDEDEADIH